ncbi:hypothetical protein IRB23M11_02770 [Alkalibacterium sp. m-11]|uniref:Uncharacterized protein n=1 Tax=Alkalibacterium indicireducens TaxID=398758 RepID=A0ABN1B5D8_9LACT
MCISMYVRVLDKSNNQVRFQPLVDNSSFAVEYPGLTLAVIETSYK